MQSGKYINIIIMGVILSSVLHASKNACKYEYFPAIATLIAHKHVSILVEFTAKNPPFKEVKEFYIRGGQLKKLGLNGYFGFDDILPAKVGHLTNGDCDPLSYKIREEYYNVVQKKILWFNNDNMDKDHSEEIKFIYKNFSALKHDFPNAILKIYGHFDKRTLHEHSSDYALFYADTIRQMLIKEGLSKEYMQTFSYSNEPMPDFNSKKIYDKVTFTIELNY